MRRGSTERSGMSARFKNSCETAALLDVRYETAALLDIRHQITDFGLTISNRKHYFHECL